MDLHSKHAHTVHSYVMHTYVMHSHVMHAHAVHAHAVYCMLYIRNNSDMPIAIKAPKPVVLLMYHWESILAIFVFLSQKNNIVKL